MNIGRIKNIGTRSIKKLTLSLKKFQLNIQFKNNRIIVPVYHLYFYLLYNAH